MKKSHSILVFIGVLMIARLTVPGEKVRADAIELFARVIVDSTSLRSGPGTNFRQIGVAQRGETFLIKRRSTQGYWFQIERLDGTFAWIMGDAVYNHEVRDGVEEGRGSSIFAPPPLQEATAELAVTFGVLDRGGMMVIRPTFFLAPEFGIELSGGASVSTAGRVFLGGVAGLVNIFPRSPVVPFFAVGGGIAFSDPNADTFLLQRGTTSMIFGGGGLRIGFRKRITLRLDARAYVFFLPDRYVAQEEFSGGLSVFF